MEKVLKSGFITPPLIANFKNIPNLTDMVGFDFVDLESNFF